MTVLREQHIELPLDAIETLFDSLGLIRELRRFEKKLVSVAVKTPMNPMPTTISPTAINRPSAVTGDTSPYPTVVVVTAAHHSASPTD